MNSKDKAELTRLFFAAKDAYMEFALAKPSISNLGILTAQDNFLKFLDGITKLTAHWVNPWDDVVIVPIEELAECHILY